LSPTAGTPLRPLDVAIDYATRYHWPVFPTFITPNGDKAPLTEHGLNDASTDAEIITAWWTRRPRALISIVTGPASGVVVLDVDVKHANAYGFDTLAELGFAILPDTPVSHTPSGGVHLHFLAGEREFRNTDGTRGERGIGPGLDWRAWGGAAAMPTPGTGYWWDPICDLTLPLAPIPPQLLPREPVVPRVARRVRPTTGLSPYADKALDRACRAIINAPRGTQAVTLNAEVFRIGMLTGAGAIPSNLARRALLWAARQIPSYDHQRPWRAHDLDAKVNHAFDDGMRQPRPISNNAESWSSRAARILGYRGDGWKTNPRVRGVRHVP
jgi:hypothetical protein